MSRPGKELVKKLADNANLLKQTSAKVATKEQSLFWRTDDWLTRKLRFSDPPTKKQPYDYNYTVPSNKLGTCGEAFAVREDKFVEEWGKVWDKEEFVYNPFKNPSEMFGTILFVLIIPGAIYHMTATRFLNQRYGEGVEVYGRKRRVFGYEDPKWRPTFEEMQAKYDQKKRIYAPDLL